MPAYESATTSSARTTLVLRVLTVATFVVILNETIMVTALPELMASLDVDAQAVQWLSTGFMLTMAVVIPTTGWFLQAVGRRIAFVTAMSCFATGTLICALSPVFETLLLGRVVQAAGTAVMMPLLMSTVVALTPEDHRGRVMGNVSLAISVAPAMGPTVSGLILTVGSWRWLFGAVLPLAVLMVLIGGRLLRSSEHDAEAHGEQPHRMTRPDLPSVALTVIGFGGLVYGLSHVGEGAVSPAAGGAPMLPTVSLAVGLVGVVLFVWRQVRLQRVGGPLLDLRVLRVGDYRLSTTIMAIAFMALMGTMIVLPLYFQQVRGLSTLQSGLMLMPGGVTMGLLGPVVGRVYDRVGAGRLVVPAAIVFAVAMGLLAWSTTHGPVWWFLVLHLVLSVALAFIFTPIFTTGLGALPGHLYEHGSALLGTAQQVAAATGTAVVVMVMSVRTAALRAAGADPVSALGAGVGTGLMVSAGLAAAVACLSLVFLRGRSTR